MQRHSLPTSRPVPKQFLNNGNLEKLPPALVLVAENDAIWKGIFILSVWLSYPGTVPAVKCWGSEREMEKALTLSTVQHWLKVVCFGHKS